LQNQARLQSVFRPLPPLPASLKNDTFFSNNENGFLNKENGLKNIRRAHMQTQAHFWTTLERCKTVDRAFLSHGTLCGTLILKKQFGTERIMF